MTKKKQSKTHYLATWLGDETDIHINKLLTALLDRIYIIGPSEKDIREAEEGVAAALEQVLPQKVFYSSIPKSDIGRIWIASNQIGIVLISFEKSEDAFLAKLSRKVHGRFIHSEEDIAGVSSKIIEYLTGKISKLDIPIDISETPEFQRKVLKATLQIPRGRVRTYGEIARRIKKPRSYRAVGQALRHNPIPIIIPCHRVISSDGTVGGYQGILGDQRKIKLLKLEGVMLA